MIGMNNKKNSKDKSSLFQRIHKFATSATVFALLFPSISSIGLVQAAEEETEDPPVEEIVPQSEADTEDINIEPEVEDTDTETETPLPEKETADTTQPSEELHDDVTDPTAEESQDTQTEETPEETTDGVQNDGITTTQLTPEQDLPDPVEVSVLVHVRAPNNMENYINTLEDFTNYPLVLTNQVTDETFTTSIRPSDNNTSNYFTLEATVHAYVRGNAPENDYDITLPQELIDLGYSLTRDHRVRSNFGIVGTTNLTYNAPQVDEVIGTLKKNTVGYSYLVGRDLRILLESLDGTRSYSLGNRDISIPAGTYNLTIGNTPTDSRPNVVYRRGTLVNVPETEIPVTGQGNEYTGTITLDFTNDSQTHVLRIIEEDLEVAHTVTIDPNGGTMNEEYKTSKVLDGDTYSLPSLFNSELNFLAHTLVGFEVDGTLLDSAGNPVTEITTYTTRNYTPESDVTLTAIWEVTAGGFRVQLYDDEPSTQKERYTVSLIAEDGTEYELTSNQFGPGHRTWRIEDVPNGTYSLVINGFNISEGEKSGQPDTTSNFVVNDDGTATVDLEFVDNKSTTFIRYKVYGEPVPEVAIYPLGIEVRDLDNLRTSDVDVEVTNEDGEVFTGNYNQYKQWFTDEELPEGLYTITLDTPEGTHAEINDTVTNQYAEPTDENNVFTILVNAENQGSLSAVFAAFRLVEDPVEIETHLLGVEVRGLDDKRTDEVGIVTTNEDGKVFTGNYNQDKQWFTDEELPVGTYTITLTTPKGTVAKINDTVALQHAVKTDEENIFTVEVNEENQGSMDAVWGAFRLVKVDEDMEDPKEPTDPEDPDDEKPTKPEDPDTPIEDDDKTKAPSDEDPSESPEDKEDTDSDKLPKTGVAGSTIGLGIASILSGLGLLTINKKRKEEEK